MSQNPTQEFNAVRQPGDRDLVAEVRLLLQQSGLEQQAAAFYDTDNNIITAKNKVPNVQRYLLNRYWILQLMASPKVSIEERFCLVPNGTLDEWFRLFQQKVLPFIVQQGLPTQLK